MKGTSMKRSPVVLVLLLASAVLAAEYFAGQVAASSGSLNNKQASPTFNAALKMTVNCNAPVNYRLCTGTPCTAVNASTGPDFPIPAGTSFDIDARYSSVPVIAFIAQDGGPFACNVYAR